VLELLASQLLSLFRKPDCTLTLGNENSDRRPAKSSAAIEELWRKLFEELIGRIGVVALQTAASISATWLYRKCSAITSSTSRLPLLEFTTLEEDLAANRSPIQNPLRAATRSPNENGLLRQDGS